MKKMNIITIIVVIVISFIVTIGLFLINKKVTIFFETNGGKSVNAIIIDKGKSIKLPETSRKGFILDGWFLGEQRVTDSTVLDKDITLKARWISIESKTFTVNFDSAGGSIVESIKVECGKELLLPTVPLKEGYIFVSWVDKNGTPVLDKALLVCEDIMLKAIWKKEDTKQDDINLTNNMSNATI